MIPTTIKYHGQLYKLAQEQPTHKRCTPDASGQRTHWNEKERKCVPLTGKLRRLHRNARNWTKRLRESAKPGAAPRPFATATGTVGEQAAAGAHDTAAKLLGHAGFSGLEAYHRRHFERHMEKAKTTPASG